MAHSPNPNRLSTMSSISAARPGGAASSNQVSTQTLLNALHTSFAQGLFHPVEFSTSLVVNTWLTIQNTGADGRPGGVVDHELAERAWNHARRRAEDGTVILGSLHPSSPSLLPAFVAAVPVQLPNAFFTSLDVIRAFTHCVTPFNPSYPRYSALASTLMLSTEGDLLNASLALSTSGLDVNNGLLNVPTEGGYRAFDVFYYLNVSSAAQAERDFLNLGPASSYSLLRKSGTYIAPSYVHTADDAAAAEDLRSNLKAIGIERQKLASLISALAGLLKLGDTLSYMVDAEDLDRIFVDVAELLDVETDILRSKFSMNDREILIGGLYEAIVDWVIKQANGAIRTEIHTTRSMSTGSPENPEEEMDTVSLNIVNIPDPALGKAFALKNVFDDTHGINAEMKQDGVPIPPAGVSVLNEMQSAVAAVSADLGDVSSSQAREREAQRDRREEILERVGLRVADDSFVKELLYPSQGKGIVLGSVGRFDLTQALESSRIWFQLNIHPTDDSPDALVSAPNPWSAAAVSTQLRGWRLAEWVNRRNRSLDFTTDYDPQEFYERYAPIGCTDGNEGIQAFVLERGWAHGDVVVGNERIWMRESAWWEAETLKDNLAGNSMLGVTPLESGYSTAPSEFFPDAMPTSRDNLLAAQSTASLAGGLKPKSLAPTSRSISGNGIPGDYGLGTKGDNYKGEITYDGVDPETGKVVVEKHVTFGRRVWVGIVWFMTWWIPSPFLRYIGRMRRPDVRLAWREKVTLVFIIFLLNALVVFYIIWFGKLLCPNWDKAWNNQEVGYHRGEQDFWVSHRGKVYDITKFYRVPHSDMANSETNSDTMMPFAGLNVDPWINPPMFLACPNLIKDQTVTLSFNNTPLYPEAKHVSGPFALDPTSKLHANDWYSKRFLPKMKEFYKGDLVYTKEEILKEGQPNWHNWVIIDNGVYDLTDYFYTKNKVQKNNPVYSFFPDWLETLVQSNSGLDVTELFSNAGNDTSRRATRQCLENYFFIGKTDYRKTPRCQVQNYLLLSFTIILCTVIGVKFLAALQLGSKAKPSPQDKFVICQVPAYTEGEEQLRQGIDSLTALAYDNKRKLIVVICDGMVVGGGNDRPTPKIVLDILGVDPKLDPPVAAFKSVGQGSDQLNYGKVYSGLYEYEGHVVPYLVVVKVGKQSEQTKSKPGNRGKRDSQILLMQFLNRVHHRAPMNPLELEMFHHINNIVGVDPELYEYLLMVDADTTVNPDSLNRLVAKCADDSKIAGICGETSLQNEERSWWTMIQVYEYYISHHLAKAFESLFGSVTCLPGCFCMYRLRTADKGRPLIISDKLIADYSDGDVDTLHKKNLLSLGEDRYLTTLMMKYFPNMSYKFVPAAKAQTAAPEKFSVLLSQRRRWINSTIHNLAELVFLRDMCGFCCFSMRFVVFIDLFGTIILPATCAYLGYLIYLVASKKGQFPLISIVMLAAVYGLQAIIFIIKRQWQHIGWMVIYIIAFPIYSFMLPIYSFWKQDDFSWGSTRLVIEEKGTKKMVTVDADEDFNPRDVPLEHWDDYAARNGLAGRRGFSEKYDEMYDDPNAVHLDEIRSSYSGSKGPGSAYGGPAPYYPQSTLGVQPMPNRASMYSLGTPPMAGAGHVRNASYTSTPDLAGGRAMSTGYPAHSTDNLVNHGNVSTPNLRPRQSTGFGSPASHLSPSGGLTMSRPQSTINFMDAPRTGPTDQEIILAVRDCLTQVDLEQVTKKHLVTLAEQKLHTALQGERKNFLKEVIDRELESMPVDY